MKNLYDLPIDGAEFTVACGGNLDSDHESCIEFAEIPGATDSYVLVDNKPEGKGQQLRMSASEIDNFVAEWTAKRGTASA
jgi:hypothetical protein